MRRRVPLLAAVAASAVLTLGGCAAADDAGSGSDKLTGEVTIYAAASLQRAFDELATRFEDANPGVDIRPIVFDGSSTLSRQLVEGAPADVFASADEANMTTVEDAGLVDGASRLFASNTLVVAVPVGNPGGVLDLKDLASDDATVVLCAPEVPCGAASDTLLSNAGVTVSAASLEQNVTAVLTKIAADEADAGLVYATDVAGRDDVESFVPDGADAVVNRYPIAALSGAADPAAAAAFVAFVTGSEGQAVLAELGFGTP